MAENLRVDLVGCGGISRVWVDAAKEIPALEMVGFVDVREDAAKQRTSEYGLRDVEIPSTDGVRRVGGHAGLIEESVRSVMTGETPETICTDNVKSLAMVFGAIESAQQRKPIDITW